MTRGARWTRLVVAGVLALVLAGCSDDDPSTDAAGEERTGADQQATDEPAGEDSTGAGPSGEFDLLAYNVAGLPQEFSSVNPRDHIPLISPRLEPYDLVLTQEDFDWWVPLLDTWDFAHYHERLRSQVSHEYRSERHPGPEAVALDTSDRPLMAVGDGLGYLSRFPLRDLRRVPWTGCFGGPDGSDQGAGDCLAMKGFAVATVQLAEGVEVDVYNLHAEAGGSDLDQELQAENVEQLVAFMLEHSEGRAVILGGDTNLHTDPSHPDAEGTADTELWNRLLEATGLRDVCAELDCDEPGAIDKVAFRSGGGVELEAKSHDFRAEDFRTETGEDLSDHDPLTVGFGWRGVSG